MSITSIYSASGSPVYESGRRSVQKQDTDEALRQESKGERVAISDTGANVTAVKGLVITMSEVRLDVVKNIKERININDYPLENNLDEALKKLLKTHTI